MRKYLDIRASIALGLIFAFLLNSLGPVPIANAGEMVMPVMPMPGSMVHLSPAYIPAHLQGITIHPENALQFDFLINRGQGNLDSTQKKEEYGKLVKYFLASLTVPDKDQWVNLSPYEKNRIIENNFGKTEMGRDLLSQDYLLKQITSSLMYPESGLGKNFWDKVYKMAYEEFGTTNIPVNTFNKVWIVPDEAIVYESGNTAYILKSHLRVMLEEDYLSLSKHSSSVTHTVTSKIIKEIILPEIEKEVNEGKNFSMLRQIYSGMILATWYKKTLKESLLGKIYADKAKVSGVGIIANEAKQSLNAKFIYQQYIQAFKKGVYNYIKEDVDRYTGQTIPRKYFSGGFVDNAQAVHIFGRDNLPSASMLQGFDFAQAADIDKASVALDKPMEAASFESIIQDFTPRVFIVPKILINAMAKATGSVVLYSNNWPTDDVLYANLKKSFEEFIDRTSDPQEKLKAEMIMRVVLDDTNKEKFMAVISTLKNGGSLIQEEEVFSSPENSIKVGLAQASAMAPVDLTKEDVSLLNIGELGMESQFRAIHKIFKKHGTYDRRQNILRYWSDLLVPNPVELDFNMLRQIHKMIRQVRTEDSLKILELIALFKNVPVDEVKKLRLMVDKFKDRSDQPALRIVLEILSKLNKKTDEYLEEYVNRTVELYKQRTPDEEKAKEFEYYLRIYAARSKMIKEHLFAQEDTFVPIPPLKTRSITIAKNTPREKPKKIRPTVSQTAPQVRVSSTNPSIKEPVDQFEGVRNSLISIFENKPLINGLIGQYKRENIKNAYDNVLWKIFGLIPEKIMYKDIEKVIKEALDKIYGPGVFKSFRDYFNTIPKSVSADAAMSGDSLLLLEKKIKETKEKLIRSKKQIEIVGIILDLEKYIRENDLMADESLDTDSSVFIDFNRILIPKGISVQRNWSRVNKRTFSIYKILKTETYRSKKKDFIIYYGKLLNGFSIKGLLRGPDNLGYDQGYSILYIDEVREYTKIYANIVKKNLRSKSVASSPIEREVFDVLDGIQLKILKKIFDGKKESQIIDGLYSSQKLKYIYQSILSQKIRKSGIERIFNSMYLFALYNSKEPLLILDEIILYSRSNLEGTLTISHFWDLLGGLAQDHHRENIINWLKELMRMKDPDSELRQRAAIYYRQLTGEEPINDFVLVVPQKEKPRANRPQEAPMPVQDTFFSRVWASLMSIFPKMLQQPALSTHDLVQETPIPAVVEESVAGPIAELPAKFDEQPLAATIYQFQTEKNNLKELLEHQQLIEELITQIKMGSDDPYQEILETIRELIEVQGHELSNKDLRGLMSEVMQGFDRLKGYASFKAYFNSISSNYSKSEGRKPVPVAESPKFELFVLKNSPYIDKGRGIDNEVRSKIIRLYEILHKVKKGELARSALYPYNQKDFLKVYRINLGQWAVYVRYFDRENKMLIVAFDSKGSLHEKLDSRHLLADFIKHTNLYSSDQVKSWKNLNVNVDSLGKWGTDAAMKSQEASPGGIDMNSAHLNLKIERGGEGIALPLMARQDVERLSNIEGFTPVIISIKPVINLPILNELHQKIQ